MYTLRSVKKSERMNHFNISLGENYHLIDRHSESYYELRKRHFSSMGFSEEEEAKFNNPFVVGKDYSLPIYLENGHEYYIMTESGKTFENLSGLVNDVVIHAKSENGEDLQFNADGTEGFKQGLDWAIGTIETAIEQEQFEEQHNREQEELISLQNRYKYDESGNCDGFPS